jgi:hypothetical protein
MLPRVSILSFASPPSALTKGVSFTTTVRRCSAAGGVEGASSSDEQAASVSVVNAQIKMFLFMLRKN